MTLPIATGLVKCPVFGKKIIDEVKINNMCYLMCVH